MNFYQLIVQYGPDSYYASREDEKYFLVHEREDGESERQELRDESELYSRALKLLNDDPRAQDGDIYLPQESINNYFSNLQAIQDLPGCYSGQVGDKKFLILPRYITEEGPLDRDHYFPLMAAHLYPEEGEEADLLLLLKELLAQ